MVGFSFGGGFNYGFLETRFAVVGDLEVGIGNVA
jgi:hypothetical protein